MMEKRAIRYSIVIFVACAILVAAFSSSSELRILNKQSYPVVGGNWTVAFETEGREDLTISAMNGTEFGEDLEWLELKCGKDAVDARLEDGSIRIDDYACSEVSYQDVRVMTTGAHYQEFRFGESKDIAANTASDVAIAFFTDSNCSDVIDETNPGQIGAEAYVRVSWVGDGGDELQHIWVAVDSYSGICTFGERSGCLADSSGLQGSGQCDPVNGNTLPDYLTDWSNAVTANVQNVNASSASGTGTLYVNHAPEVSSVDLTPQDPMPTDNITCTATFSDADSSQTHSATGYWTINGAQTAFSNNSCASGSCSVRMDASSLSDGDVVNCTMTIADQFNATGTGASDTATITDSAAPALPTDIAASDVRGDQGGNISVTWTRSSDDGDNANDVLGYYVLRSTVETGGFSNITSLLAPGTEQYYDNVSVENDGITYYYKIRVCDTSLNTNCAETDAVSASANAQPVMIQMDYEPERPGTLDNISCMAWAYDIDGTNLSMEYTIRVTAFPPGGSTTTITGSADCVFFGENVTDQYGNYWENATTECFAHLDSAYTTLADKVTCSFTARDRYENSSSISTQGFIAINNTPPYATDVNIEPETPNQSSTLSCEYTYNDPDNQAENTTTTKYKWYINNEGMNEFVEVLGYTDKTISGIFDKDDALKCAVKVHDTDPSWIDYPLYDNEYVMSEVTYVRDNAVPQITDYSQSTSDDEPAVPGEGIIFNVSWVDHEDPEDTARIYVCDDFEETEDQSGDGNRSVSFGDFAEGSAKPIWIYTNQTGQYVHKVAIKPYKYIRNNMMTYMPDSHVEPGDFDIGLNMTAFANESYYDKDLSETYDREETIIRENLSVGTPLIYEARYDAVVQGPQPPDGVQLTNFSETNLHMYRDLEEDGFTEDDDIYLLSPDPRTGTEIIEGDRRISIVSQSSTDSLSTEFIYDIIVREVNTPGETEGPVIARDNDNSLMIGQYNYFVPQYNAQPLPDRYLAIQFCIDHDNNDVCDANADFMNDTVYIKVSGNRTGYIIRDHTGNTNLSNPPVKIYYGRDDTPGCKGTEYCSTANSASNDVSCTYTAREADLWNNTYRVKVCDEHDACSDYRQGHFYVNHLPVVDWVRINTSDYTGNFTDGRNLICEASYHDDQEPETIYNWYLNRNGSGYVRQALPNTEFIGDGFTEPGDFWKCSLTVYDGYDYSPETYSEPINIKGGVPVQLHVTSASSTSSADSPAPVGESITFSVDWYSISDKQVKAYVCNSSNITETGCIDRTFTQSEFTRDNPIRMNYTGREQDNFTENYWIRLCDTDWNCSDIFPDSGTVDFAVNHRPNASNVNITVIDGSTINCSYTYTDTDNHEKSNLTDYVWYRNEGDGFYPMQGDMNQTLTIDSPQNEMYKCSVLVYDEFNLSDDSYVNSSNVHIFGTLPGQAILESLPSTVNRTIGIGLVGYYNMTPVNITAHVRQEYNISSLVNESITYNSTYYGSSTNLATIPKGNNFVIVRSEDISSFQPGSWVEFSNHKLEFFRRYQVTGITDLLDGSHRLALDRPLQTGVVSGNTKAYGYNSTYPKGWFNITLPTLFNGTNTVKVRGRTESGYGPYQNIEMYADLEDPYINTSTFGNFTTGRSPTIVFDVKDNHASNLSTLHVQLINASHRLNYSVSGSAYNDTLENISCTGNDTDQRCNLTLNLADNTSYSIVFRISDAGGNNIVTTKSNYHVNTSIQPLRYVENGFVDDTGELQIPAVIATNSTLSARWENVPLGLIGSYEYKLDEYENNGIDFIKNIVNWTSTGLNESVNVSESLRNQKVYKFTVRIRWLDGTTSPEKTSSGIIYYVDDAPRCIGQCLNFVDDSGNNITFSSEDRLVLAWNFSSEAPITQYRIVIGTVRYPYPGYNNLLDETVYSTTLNYVGSFPDNETVYANVRAMNENGIWSNWLDSSIPEVTIDKSDPYGGSISYPNGIVSTNITVTMYDGSDDVSGIASRKLYRSTREFVRGSCQGMNIYYPVLNVSPGPGQTYTEDIQNGKCYRFKYRVTDRAGNWVEYPGSEGYDVMTDTTPPAAFTVSLNDGYFITTNSLFDIGWTPSDDPESGISHYSYILQEDGNSVGNWTNITNSSNTTSTNVQITIDNPQHGSSYKALVTAYSQAYDSTPLFRTVASNNVIYLDNSAPDPVEIISVEDETTPVAGRYLDTIDNGMTTAELLGEPGIVCVGSEYYIDYEMYDPSKDYLVNCSTPEGTESNFTCEFNSTHDGDYTYYIVCEDSAGNQQFASESTEVSFTAEVKGPGIEFIYPQENELVGDIIEFRFNITDISGVASKTYMIVNRTNTSQVYASGTIANQSLDWNSYMHFSNNTANLSLIVYAVDTFGHSSNETLDFFVDNTRPVIIIREPNVDERYFREDFTINISIRNNFVNASYNITDENGSLVQGNSTYFANETNSFNWSEPFTVADKPDGRYRLSVYAKDIHGNDQTKSFTFFLDRRPPRYSYAVNAQPPVYNDENVIVSVIWPSDFNLVANTCDLDEVIIEHDANGSAYNYTPTIEGNNFSLFIPAYLLDNQETITWRSYARDFSGNVNQTPYYNFTIENRPPGQVQDIGEIMWPTNINYTMNTTEYFQDPDRDELNYSVEFLIQGISMLDHLDTLEHTVQNSGTFHNPAYSSGIMNNSAVIGSASQNLVNDSSFEQFNGSREGFYKWAVSGSPRLTGNSTTGRYGARVNRNNYYYQDIPVQDNLTYSLSAEMRAASGTANGRLHVNWYAEGGFYLGTSMICGGGSDCLYSPVANETWQRFGAAMQPPEFTSFARVFADAQNSSYIHVDDIQFEQKEYPTAYIQEGMRNESYIIYDVEESYDQTQGTVMFWAKPFIAGDMWSVIDDIYNPFIELSDQYTEIMIGQGKDENSDVWALARIGATDLLYNISSWEQDSWHQIALTWEDNNISFYVDGILINSTNSSMTSIDDMYVGRDRYLDDPEDDYNYAESYLDELTLFKAALNSSQISEAYSSRSLAVGDPQINYTGTPEEIVFFTDGIFVGEYTAEITANDSLATVTSNFFRVRAGADNEPPVIQPIPDMVVNESERITLYVNATDADLDPLTLYTDTGSINATGFFRWTPRDTEIGNNTVEITACDNSSEINNCTTESFMVTVLLRDEDNDSIPYSIDYLIGTLEDINSTNPEGYTLPGLNLTLDGISNLSQQFVGEYDLSFTTEGAVLAEFTFNFSNTSRLDLKEVSVARYTPGDSPSYTYINGLGQIPGTKMLIVQDLNSTVDTVCIKDSDGARNIEVSARCDGSDEFLIYCNGTATGQYTCTDYGTYYRVDGLNHSAVIEMPGCQDRDNDGYGRGPLCHGYDCDDDNASINPNATDIAYDGIDQDCNGYDNLDMDDDGYCAEGWTISNMSVQCPNEGGLVGTDCDDTRSDVNPGRNEVPGNSIDEDCDGTVEESSSSSSGGGGHSGGGSTGYAIRDPQCDDGMDNDGDGLIDLEDPGCEDAEDDNETDPCIEDWECTGWSRCTEDGRQTRECHDANECGTSKERPNHVQECDYLEQSCHDYTQNQEEEGVDCGGPCEMECATCHDGRRNCYQQTDGSILCEEGIDCGRPCEIECATCHDGKRNCHPQPGGEVVCEEGIDCGGPCGKCPETEEPSDLDLVPILSWLLILLVAAGLAVLLYNKRTVIKSAMTTKPMHQAKDDSYFASVERKETMILYELEKGRPMHEIEEVAANEGIETDVARKLVILYNYVKSMQAKGFKRPAITSYLKARGWPDDMIGLVFVFQELVKASRVLVKAIRQWKDIEGVTDERINYMLVQKGIAKQVIQYAYILYEDQKTSTYPEDKQEAVIRKEHMDILLELHKGTQVEKLEMQMRHRNIPQGLLEKMVGLDRILKQGLSSGENAEMLESRLFAMGYDREVIDFAVKLIYLEIDVLQSLRNGKPVSVIRHELKEKGWPKEIVDNVMKYKDKNNPLEFRPKLYPGQVFVLNALHKGIDKEKIASVLKSRGYPDDTMSATLALINHVQGLKRKGHSKMDTEKILARNGWTDEAIEALVQYFF